MCSQIQQLFVDVLIYFILEMCLSLSFRIIFAYFHHLFLFVWHIQRKEEKYERKLCCGHRHLKKKPSSSDWELQGPSTIVGWVKSPNGVQKLTDKADCSSKVLFAFEILLLSLVKNIWLCKLCGGLAIKGKPQLEWVHNLQKL